MQRVLLVDPPWQYNNRHETRLKKGLPKFGYGAEIHYGHGAMSIAELESLEPLISAVSAPEAYMFLWCSEAMPIAHLEVLSAWKFEPVATGFVWVKTYRNTGSPFFGPGRYTGTNIERCILARRGKKLPCWHSCKAGCFKPSQVILEPHPADDHGKIIHSRKPDECHERIEEWLAPYLDGHGMLELFARRHRPGWTCIGGDLSGRDIREDLADLAAGKILPSAPDKRVGQRGLFDEEESA